MCDENSYPSSSKTRVSRSAWLWWKDRAARQGRLAATKHLLLAMVEFARDSTPQRRRLRFGDAEFDWQHRVNTTSGAVTWRDRLLGVFHSPYQPTDAPLFQEMIAALREQPGFDFSQFTFIDIGSGKGRALLMASEYPFRRILGVELLPALHGKAQENIGKYRSETQRCVAIESICMDAAEFEFPAGPLLLFLFNPLPESGLRRVLANLERSLRRHRRRVYVLYHNPLLASVLAECPALEKAAETHQYALYIDSTSVTRP